MSRLYDASGLRRRGIALQALTRLWPTAALAAVALAVTAPLASRGAWPMGHDELYCHYRLDHFREAVREGVLYPRWLPDAYGGYGYPTFVFYPPGFFFAALPAATLFEDLTTAVYVTLTWMVFAGAAGAYRIGTQWGDRPFALFCGAMFAITPYLFVDLFVRCALAELSAMLAAPWPLYFLLRLWRLPERPPAPPQPAGGRFARGRRELGASVGLAVSLAAVIYCHPATALFLTAALACIAVWIVLAAGNRSGRFGIAALGAVLMAVALATPYWQPLFALKSEVAHAAAVEGYFTAREHLATWEQLVSPAWGYGPSTSGDDDGMSFALGLPHFLLAAVGAAAGRRLAFVQAAAMTYLALVLMMTPLARPLWEAIPLLDFVQFPWRILSVTASLQAVCIAAGAGIYRRLGAAAPLALAGLFLLAAAWSHEQFGANPRSITDADVLIARERQQRLNAFHTYAGRNEFTPHAAVRLSQSAAARGERPMVRLLSAEGQGSSTRRLHFVDRSARHVLHVRMAPGDRAVAVLEQLYFPGWEVAVNGQRIDDAALAAMVTEDGRMQVAIKEGNACTLQARYAGPPGGRLRLLVVLASRIAFLVLQLLLAFRGQTGGAGPRDASRGRERQASVRDEGSDSPVSSGGDQSRALRGAADAHDGAAVELQEVGLDAVGKDHALFGHQRLQHQLLAVFQ